MSSTRSDRPIFALADCNNFYASCERVFSPRLATRPIVILSNNDGCIIARSNEAKQLGIPMGAPYFKWRDFCAKHRVTVLSSNYELYGDMSARVMSLLEAACPDIEMYSIDEAFLRLEKMDIHDVTGFGIDLRRTLLRQTGIPVSIGIAATKTLAKIANHVAKKQTSCGVFDMRDPDTLENTLDHFPVSDLWGIGRQLSIRLQHQAILTARQLRDSHAPTLRRQFGIGMEKILLELRGIACHDLEESAPRQQILSSRSFGSPVCSLEELEEAISHYAAIACEKLRSQGSIASFVHVFLKTSPFAKNRQPYARTATFTLPSPLSDTAEIISAAKQCLQKIYRPHLEYKKAGIMLAGLSSACQRQASFFSKTADSRREILMATIDDINRKMGKHHLRFLAEGIDQPWKTKRQRCSPGYTTRWDELPLVYC